MVRTWRTVLTGLALMAMGAVACGKKPPVQVQPPPPPPPVVQPTPTPPPPPPAPTPKPTPPPPPRVPTEDEIFASKTLEQINQEGPLVPVFFHYDKADLTDEGRATLQKNAEWMRRWASTRVMVEGHADSRGTNEYNVSLGERRAVAVRDYIVSLGIPAARLSIVSKGEESPLCREETEACWQRNRRAFFIVTAK